MQSNPTQEWQRLSSLYAEMSDGELEELAAGFSDLTEFAQPILRDELKKRGLGDPSAIQAAAKQSKTSFAGWRKPADPQSEEEVADDAKTAVAYTWKTPLCERDTYEEAWQLAAMLRRAGIESWPDTPGSTFGTRSVAENVVRILVAADQLEDARAVIAQRIPQDIVDESREKPEDFVPPTCPKCGAEDPTLESVDPTNSWLCESCGAQWSDAEDAEGVTNNLAR